MIEINDLKKSYYLNAKSEQVNILQGLNLKVNSGEVIAIVGSSGSGKSTLLGLLSGLDQPDSGEVKIDQKSLQQMSPNDLTQFRSSRIGIVFQQYYLVNHLTAYENLTLPLDILDKKYDQNSIDLALENVGLLHRSDHRPTEMSGGECQRLALARALIIKPSLLLADEPSGSLDTETGQKVMALFFEQVRQQNTTTILVTHDLDLARKCDRIYKLNHGQLEIIKNA
ncbi:MAG: ABC transporter ATP-binding protein [Pseudobdellovibrio sp.]